jgi:hypothetical protein
MIISPAYNPTLDMLYAGTRDQGLLQIPSQSDVPFTPSIHSKTRIKHVKGSKVMLTLTGRY